MTRKSGRVAAPLTVEQLEPREVLSTTATLVGSTLQIRVNDSQGTGGFFLVGPEIDNDTVLVFRRGSRIDVKTYSAPDVQGFFLTDPGTTTMVGFDVARVRSVAFYAGQGNDTFTNETSLRASAFGGSGNDTFSSNGNRDFFAGGSGFMTVFAHAGAAVVNAGALLIDNLPGGTPQTTNTCGPNSAWRVMKAYGGLATYQQLIDHDAENSIISRWALGTTGATLVDTMNSLRRGVGSKTFSLKTRESFDDLLGDLGSGKPLVTMISAPGSTPPVNLAAVAGAVLGGAGGAVLGGLIGNLPGVSDYSNYSLPNLHWIALTGFNRRLQVVYFTDTDGNPYQMSFASFKSVWDWNFGPVANTFLQGLGVVPRTYIV
jgi:hypothetical protein